MIELFTSNFTLLKHFKDSFKETNRLPEIKSIKECIRSIKEKRYFNEKTSN